MNLRYFSNVVPEVQQGTEGNLVDLIFSVEEQSTSSVNFGVTFSGATDDSESFLPISLFAKVENSNLFGEGRTVSAGTTLAPNEQSINLAYSQNWIGKYPIAFNAALSFSHAKTSSLKNQWTPNLELIQNRYFMNYNDWSVTLSSGLSRRWTPDYAIFYGSFSVDNRDLNYDPSKGWFGSQRFTWHGLIPGLEKEFYLRSDTKLEGYFKLFDIPVTDNWNFKMVFAAYTGFSAIIPVENGINTKNAIYVDGLLNGRGWSDVYKEARGLAMLSNRVELRVPVVPGIIGVDGFWDAAVVKPKLQDMGSLGLEDFYFSYGPGIRVLIPQLPLHLMFAWRYRIEDGKPKFAETPFNFVLSFNVVNY